MSSDRRKRSRRLAAWWPALLWALGIWLLGSDLFSANETSRILDPLIGRLWPELDPESRAVWVAAIRKLAHPSVYGVQALLCLRALELDSASPAIRLFARSLIPLALLAAADELRQAFSAGRTGALADVGLDLLGGLATWVAVALIEAGLGRPLFRSSPED
jgi:VanZ family protein